MGKGRLNAPRLVTSILLVFSGLLVVLSSIYPWWVMTVTEVTSGRSSWIHIHAWGLVHNMSELRQFVMRHETPPPLMLAAQLYLASLAILAIVSAILLLKNSPHAWKPAFLAGVTYLLYTLAFLPVLHEGTSTAPRPVPMQGEKWEFIMTYSVRIITYFDTGYYLAITAAILLLLLSLIAWRYFKR